MAAGQFFQSLEVSVLANSESQAFGFVSQDSIHEFNAIIRKIGVELIAKAAGNRSFHAEAGTAALVGDAPALIRASVRGGDMSGAHPYKPQAQMPTSYALLPLTNNTYNYIRCNKIHR